MTKRQLIDEIVSINKSAPAAFLAGFDDGELNEYLEHLKFAQEPKPSVDSGKYDSFFESANPLAVDDQDVTLDTVDSQPLPLFKAPSSHRPVKALAQPRPAVQREAPAPAIAAPEPVNSPSVGDDESEAWLY